MVPFIQTREGVTVFLNNTSYDIQSSDSHYQDVIDVLKRNEPDADQQLSNIIERALNAVKAAVVGQSDIVLQHGTVYYNGQPLHNTLTDRLVRMVDEGFNVEPLVNFLRRLMQNPSFRVVTHLYEFLEVGGVPITPDGCFLTYKAVRKDFKDIYTGTIDNSIGQVVQVPRNQVDENPDQTCSHGLHVCSFNYLPHFAHADGHIVVCKVDPADVVAIPADYNNTKMRVCKYEVVGEHKDYYIEHKEDILRSRSVIDSWDRDTDENLEDDYEDDYEDDRESSSEWELVEEPDYP